MNEFIENVRQKLTVKVTTFILLLSGYFAFVLNQPVIGKIFALGSTVPDWWFPYTAPILLLAAFVIIYSLFAIPYLIKPFAIFLVLTSAAALYASQTFQVMFDMTMMENLFETNSAEASFYINGTSLLFVLLYGVLPSIVIALVRFEYRSTLGQELFSRIVLVISALLVILMIVASSYKNYASVGRNNHYLNKMIIPAHVFNGVKYIKRTYLSTPLEYKQIGDDAELIANDNGKPTMMIFILGETARGMNYAYNGYHRETNPYTQNQGFISLADVQSCGTYTALSVPCMFSNMTRENYNKERAYNQDNVLDVIAKAGVEVLWVENDGGDKGVAKRLPKVKIDPKQKVENCNGITCYDAEMLRHIDNFLAGDDVKNRLLVLHGIGSHGPTYWQRYPKAMARYTPSCDRSDIEKCSDEEIRNVYDNTIAYTDYVTSKLVEKLENYSDKYNVALMYISDHGESLGENGLYLHGTPYAIAPKEQTTVPWLIWMPQQYAEQKHIDPGCLEGQTQVTHDNLFHTLLGLYGVKTAAKQSDLDLTARCSV
ncbi:phosphoethanolamine--lipid A transferase [Shewanella sp. AS1]|uniref:phosphoethanolamine transferase n=1 Tax=Shewanella sp. AS1 TaxID=2907626 RepID=UPI001F3AFE7A|nr:phosphoethanolamine--lipid A transferase [Shewanella sp. AS1]MCE9679817.1 phosphoethanolamine--lipid A transferase [Shewanella sp. AS1]